MFLMYVRRYFLLITVILVFTQVDSQTVSESTPSFINGTRTAARYERTSGSSIVMRCPVKGNPPSTITWTKDGSPLPTGSWSFTIQNLKANDSGAYTCWVANSFGEINATIHLQVKEKLNWTRPDLSVFHPLNTTVKYGSSATFQCRVRSETPPNIQWLKKVENLDPSEFPKDQHDIIKVQGENFRVLRSSEVVERSDGSFLNKLTISEVYEADSGKYICLGANSMGYSFRSAYLTVLPRPPAMPLGWSRSVAVHPGHPSSLLVAIPIALGVLVGLLVALVVLCHRRRLESPCPREEGVQKADELSSEVELEGTGAVVTRICLPSGHYENCFGIRNEV